eukprot:m.25869 g.25869  ORF g.25869 m.25869 type:complete len:150 (+) comp4273_c0_seq1:300-749(+)
MGRSDTRPRAVHKAGYPRVALPTRITTESLSLGKRRVGACWHLQVDTSKAHTMDEPDEEERTKPNPSPLDPLDHVTTWLLSAVGLGDGHGAARTNGTLPKTSTAPTQQHVSVAGVDIPVGWAAHLARPEVPVYLVASAATLWRIACALR